MNLLRKGTTLGPYRVIEQIGIGGMSKIYKAYQPSMERYVALKVLPRHYAEDPKFVERFNLEARTIAQLEHKNILPVYDFGEEDGTTYLVMRYLEGGTLKDILAQGRLTLNDIAELMTQVCAASDYAHRQGVVHRDVKPSNIIIDDEGSVYLSDFGIAKVLASASELTDAGAAIGTPAYMAPEQCLGKSVDSRTDIYALGVILYEMIVERVPFIADTPMAVALAHIHEPLPLPRRINPEIPEPIEAVIIKAMAKVPDDRYQTANELAGALKHAVPEASVTPVDSTLSILITQAGVARRDQAVVKAESAEAPAVEALPAPQKLPKRWLFPGRVVALVIGAVILLVVGTILGPRILEAIVKPLEAVAIAPTEILEAISTTEQADAAEITPMAAGGEDISKTVSGIYDTFDDPAYDGAINTSIWNISYEPGCEVAQKDGMLVTTNRMVPRIIRCDPWISRPDSVRGWQLETLEARMKLSSEYSGKAFGSGFEVGVKFDDGYWGAVCDIGFRNNLTGATFMVNDSRLGDDFEETNLNKTNYALEFDKWYTIRLQVDPDTMTFSCMIEGRTIGSYSPENVEELREARFRRRITVHRAVNTVGTVFIDDFRMIPPSSKPEVPARACVQPPSGLVSWWPGDGNANDIQDANNGTLENGATFAPGLVGRAFSFDASGSQAIKADFVSIPGKTNLANLQELTIEAWVRLDTERSPSFRIERFVTIGPGMAVLRHDGDNSPGQLHFYMRIDGKLRSIRADKALQTGTFHHVAGTYDGSYMRLYLDGAQVGLLAATGTVDAEDGYTTLSSDSEPLHGLLDEVGIYNRALSPVLISRIYTAGRDGKCKS